MNAADAVILSLHQSVDSLRTHNDTLRIENDHIRADLVNMTRDNAALVAKVRELESRAACDGLRCQGFTV